MDPLMVAWLPWGFAILSFLGFALQTFKLAGVSGELAQVSGARVTEVSAAQTAVAAGPSRAPTEFEEVYVAQHAAGVGGISSPWESVGTGSDVDFRTPVFFCKEDRSDSCEVQFAKYQHLVMGHHGTLALELHRWIERRVKRDLSKELGLEPLFGCCVLGLVIMGILALELLDGLSCNCPRRNAQPATRRGGYLFGTRTDRRCAPAPVPRGDDNGSESDW